MKMHIVEQKSREEFEVEIIRITSTSNIPLVKDGWQFNWKNEYKDKSCEIYALRQIGKSGRDVEAMLTVQWMNEDNPKHKHILLKTLEVAPHNFRSNGKYDRPAGCLIAFTCKKSFEVDNAYQGFVMIHTKTDTIGVYANKYGAILTNFPYMMIESTTSRDLIDEYLDENLI